MWDVNHNWKLLEIGNYAPDSYQMSIITLNFRTLSTLKRLESSCFFGVVPLISSNSVFCEYPTTIQLHSQEFVHIEHDTKS